MSWIDDYSANALSLERSSFCLSVRLLVLDYLINKEIALLSDMDLCEFFTALRRGLGFWQGVEIAATAQGKAQ